MVGSADSQDIQLCGMGIQAEHCVINITSEGAVFLNPYKNSRYFSIHLTENMTYLHYKLTDNASKQKQALYIFGVKMTC